MFKWYDTRVIFSDRITNKIKRVLHTFTHIRHLFLHRWWSNMQEDSPKQHIEEACYENYSLQFLLICFMHIRNNITKHHADIRLIGFEWMNHVNVNHHYHIAHEIEIILHITILCNLIIFCIFFFLFYKSCVIKNMCIMMGHICMM